VHSHAQLAAAAVGYEAALTLYNSCLRQADRRLTDALASEWLSQAGRAGRDPGFVPVAAVPELAGVEARLRDVVANAWGLLWGLHAPGGQQLQQQGAGGSDSAGAAGGPPGAGTDALGAPPVDFAPGAADVRDWEPSSLLVPQLQCSDPSAVFDIVAAFCEEQQQQQAAAQAGDRDGPDDGCDAAPRGARAHRRGQQPAAGPLPRLLLRTLLDPFPGFHMGAHTPAPSVHGGAASSAGGAGSCSGCVAASSAAAGAGEDEGDGLHGPAPSPPRSVPGTGHQLPLQQQPQHGAMDEEAEGGEAAGDEQQHMEELDAGSDEGSAQAAQADDEGAAAVAEAGQPEREHTLDVSGAPQADGCGAAGAAASGTGPGWSWSDGAVGFYDEW